MKRLFAALSISKRALRRLPGLLAIGFLPFAPVALAESNATATVSSQVVENEVVEKQTVKGRLVIIIDDIGNHFELGQRAIELPGKLNYAVLPHTPQGTRLARYASAKGVGKEVLLHMPMEAMGEQILGPAGLYNRLSREEFVSRIDRALAEIPNAQGVSNHMGSFLTQQRDKMNWLMAELNQRDLYFLDSRTASTSSARGAAQDHKVPYLARDFFLDHKRNAEAMEGIMNRAIQSAEANGFAVVIGHPYRSTLSFLEKQLPTLQERGIALLNVSEAIARESRRLASLN